MPASNFDNFMQLNRNLLNCYGTLTHGPEVYKTLSAAQQRDWCLSERSQVEEVLMNGNLSVQDFFAAAKAEWRTDIFN